MRVLNGRDRVLFVATALGALSVLPESLRAQDVLIQGRAAGVAPPAEIMRALAQDSLAFEFRRAWKQKAARVRARRAAVGPALGPSYGPAELIAAAAAMTGTMYVPVIPGVYSDLTVPFAPSAYQDRLFEGGAGAVSVSGLYSEMSRGTFTFSGSVLPWLSLPEPSSYYEPSAADDKYGNVIFFLFHALQLADPVVDFGQFDNDGPDGVPNSGDDDGLVDVAAFVYPTVAKSCGGDATGIWPHRSSYSAQLWMHQGDFSAYSTADAAAGGGFIKVDDYIIQSGLRCDGSSIMGTGTMSHELGHALGLPDLYDVDPNDGTDSEGIGHWGLMGNGSWNRQTSPAHMSAWSKDRLGWLSVTTVASNTAVTLPAVQGSGQVVRVNAPETSEYFLLSNRQRQGSDAYLHEPGLLIWHIDPAKADASGNNVNVDPTHKGVDLEEADGRDDLDFSRNRGDASDPFPGATGSTEFTSATYPSSDSYAGSFCSVGVRSISASGGGVSLAVSPSERLQVWGDLEGDGTVDDGDVFEALWYALGWRGGDLRRVDDGDVDADGDIDVRDGFMIDAFRRGSSVPSDRLGTNGFVDCAALFSAPAPAVGGTGREGGRGGRR
jgi:M6 family metalloprotease-like protein